MKKNKQFLTPEELLEKWQIDYEDLFNLVKRDKIKQEKKCDS